MLTFGNNVEARLPTKRLESHYEKHETDQPQTALDTLSNGLSYLINRMVGQPLYSHITLERGERSELADLASELL